MIDPKVTVEISSKVDADPNLKLLDAEINSLQKATGKSSDAFAELDSRMRELAQQKTIMSTFRELKTDALGLRTALAETQANITNLSSAIKQTADPTGKLGAALKANVSSARELSNEFSATTTKLSGYRAAINSVKGDTESLSAYNKRLNAEYRAMGAAVDEAVAKSRSYRSSVDQQSETIDTLRKDLSALRAEIRGVNANNIDTYSSIAALSRLKASAGESKGELVVLVNSLRELAQEQQALITIRRLEASLAQLSVSAEQTKQRIADYAMRMTLSGDATGEFAAKQQKALVALEGINNATIQTSKRLDSLKAQYSLTGASGAALAKAQDDLRLRFDAAASKADSLVASLRRVQEQEALAGKNTSFLSTQIANITSSMATFFGIYQLAGFVNDTRKLSEEWQNLSARLSIVTDSEAELTSVRQSLLDVSNNTFTTLKQTMDVYIAAKDSLDQYGMSNQSIIDITSTWNKTLQLSGSSAQAAEGATMQFTQALGAGRVMAEEFNSMVEGNRFLMIRLAKEILGENGTVSALKKMASDGNLTSKVLVDAFAGIKDAVDKDFGTLPVTITRAMNQVKTAYMQFVGESEAVTETTMAIAGALQYVAKNMDTLATATIALGGAYAVFRGMSAAATVLTSVAESAIAASAASAGATLAINGVAMGLGALVAAVAGFKFGTYLKDAFVEVELAGIALMSGLHQLGVSAEYTFKILANPVNAIGYWQEMQVELEKVRQGYTDLADDAVASHTQTVATAKEVAEAEKQAAKSLTDVAAASKLASEGANKLGVDLDGIASGVVKTSREAIQAFGAIAADAKTTGAQIAGSLGAAINDIEQKDLPLLKSQFVASFQAGRVSADEFKQGMVVLSAQMGTVNDSTSIMRATIEAAFENGSIGVLEYSKRITELNAGHAEVAANLSGIAAKALEAWQNSSISADQYQAVLVATSGSQTELANSADILKIKLEQMYRTGIITGEEYDALVKRITGAQEAAIGSTDALTTAMQGLGLVSSAAMAAAADKAEGLYRQVAALGGTAYDTEKAFLAYADAQLKADQATGKLTDSALEQQAAALGLSGKLATLAKQYEVTTNYQETHTTSTVKAGKALKEAATSAEDAASGYTSAGKAAAGAVAGVDALTSATQRSTTAWQQELDARDAAVKASSSVGATQNADGTPKTGSYSGTVSSSVQSSMDTAKSAGLSDAAISAITTRITNEVSSRYIGRDYGTDLNAAYAGAARMQAEIDRAVAEALKAATPSSVGYSDKMWDNMGNVGSPGFSSTRTVNINLATANKSPIQLVAKASDEDALINMLRSASLTSGVL